MSFEIDEIDILTTTVILPQPELTSTSNTKAGNPSVRPLAPTAMPDDLTTVEIEVV